MKLLLMLILPVFLVSADIKDKIEYDSINVVIKDKNYEISIPKGFELNTLNSIEEQEYVFSYPDSSCIYIGNFFHTKNEPNIKLLGDSFYNLRYQNNSLTKEINLLSGKELIPLRPDTLDLMGIQKNKLNWKEIVIGDINMGYYNVSTSKIDIFDRALSSLRQNGVESTISIKAQGKTYFVVQLFSRFTEDGEYIKSLHVEKNKKTIANINFPSSEDIKNFSVNIKKQRKNCILECFYGGGDNFYSRLFYFRCAKDNLYLYKIIETHTIVNSDKVITKKQYMQPQINITKFNILNYIENTP